MTALSAPRKTLQRGDEAKIMKLACPIAASTRVWGGGIAVSSGGYAKPGLTATSLIALGVFVDSKDNSAGSAGALIAEVERGTWKLDNSSSTDTIAQADCYANCYIVDDHTVAKTDGSGTRSVAGKVLQVDSDGVWVEIGV